MKDITRREFLRLAGAAAAAAGVGGCAKSAEDPYSMKKPPVPGSEGWYRGKEKWMTTTCAQCPVGCGINVRVVEGRVIKVEGNRDSPINRGGVGPKGQSAPYVIYDPDRIKSPLKRAGSRGEGTFKEISWEEAISDLTSFLSSMRSEKKSHQLAVICGRHRGFMADLWKRFCRAFGTPNFFDPLDSSHGALHQAMHLMMGIEEVPGNDWSSTSYVLSLGASLFESTCQGIYFARESAFMRRGAAVHRAKIVQVEPAYSLTAFQSDEWIPIVPGTYDALALGLAHIIVKEALYDHAFINEHTYGFEKFREILEEYHPQRVSVLTGIPQDKITEIANEMIKYRPSVAMTDVRSTSTSNGLQIASSALALNALLGSIDRPGGLVVQRKPPLLEWAEAQLDDAARHASKQPRIDLAGVERFPFSSSVLAAVPEQIMQGKPYPLQALLVYYANPLFARVNPDRYREAFKKIPYIVSFSPFMDETALFSDLILPDHTYLERWEDGTPTPSVGYPVFGIRQPVVKPLLNTRNTGDVMIEVAKKIGGGVAKSFPWEDFKEAMEERISGLFKSRKGAVVKVDQEAFLKALYKKGFWALPDYKFGDWKEVFKTPSGKFEFFSQTGRAALESLAKKKGETIVQLLGELGEEGLDRACLPHAKAPIWSGDPSKFPLYFLPYSTITYAEGSGANLPWLQELGNIMTGTRWESCVEISLSTARDLGISKGDIVWVESPAGKVKACAIPRSGIPKDIALMATGLGHKGMGRYARNCGANPMEILVPRVDPLGGAAPVWGTRVRIVKA